MDQNQQPSKIKTLKIVLGLLGLFIATMTICQGPTDLQTQSLNSYSQSYYDPVYSYSTYYGQRELRRGGGGGRPKSSATQGTKTYRTNTFGFQTGMLLGYMHMAYLNRYDYHYYGDQADQQCLPEDKECIETSNKRALQTQILFGSICGISCLLTCLCIYCKNKKMKNEVDEEYGKSKTSESGSSYASGDTEQSGSSDSDSEYNNRNQRRNQRGPIVQRPDNGVQMGQPMKGEQIPYGMPVV